MNIFGLSLTTTDIWLLTIAGALVMLLLGVYVPAAIKRRYIASEEYRRSFDGVLLNLRENPDCPIAQIVFGFHNEHLAAIDRFRSFMPVWKRKKFERDVEKYKLAYDEARDFGNVFAVALSEKTDVAKAKRKVFSNAIQKLLSYA